MKDSKQKHHSSKNHKNELVLFTLSKLEFLPGKKGYISGKRKSGMDILKFNNEKHHNNYKTIH